MEQADLTSHQGRRKVLYKTSDRPTLDVFLETSSPSKRCSLQIHRYGFNNTIILSSLESRVFKIFLRVVALPLHSE